MRGGPPTISTAVIAREGGQCGFPETAFAMRRSPSVLDTPLDAYTKASAWTAAPAKPWRSRSGG